MRMNNPMTHGPQTPRQFAEARKDLLREMNRMHGVIESVNDLHGWHLVEAELCKPGVYRIVTSRRCSNGGAEMRHGFSDQAIITTAIELGYLSAPNGYTLP